MKAAVPPDRAVLEVSGEEAAHFLHNLVTSSVENLAAGQARYAALLTPQGKIIADFLVLATGSGFLLDVAADRAAELKKRLTLYKLRARVSLAVRDDLEVTALWDGAEPPTDAFADPRLPELGWRMIAPKDAELSGVEAMGADAYHAHRIALGVPEGGRDFAFDDAFPHEADLDQLGGIDFRKGCYIGQEVVSRMQHRATARTRVVPAQLSGFAEPGAEIMAGEKRLGTLGSVAGNRALALIRLDRAEDAMAAGENIHAGNAVLKLEKPGWARFRLPGDPAPASSD